MPYRPDFSSHTPRPSVARYKDRVGRLYRDERELGFVLVRVQSYCEQVGGHLWWRRWSSPEDALDPWTIIDGTLSDSWLPADAIDDELADYDAGRFDYYAELLCVTWTDPDESERLREQHFGT
ncbi:MAG: hypothetical protein M3P83_09000 [Actinomycetota bacterium]|nr:hypothetical protein [Actinomycetota bacterium]